MPTFDEVIRVSFTPEQAETHIVALTLSIKRMERYFQGINIKISEALQAGDRERAEGLIANNENRLRHIKEAKSELDRMKRIFGVKNEHSKN